MALRFIHTYPGKSVLLVAHSNTGADQLVEGVLKAQPDIGRRIIRFGNEGRVDSAIGHYQSDRLECVQDAQIVASTLSNSCPLPQLGRRGLSNEPTFSLVIVDESDQSPETATLIPL